MVEVNKSATEGDPSLDKATKKRKLSQQERGRIIAARSLAADLARTREFLAAGGQLLVQPRNVSMRKPQAVEPPVYKPVDWSGDNLPDAQSPMSGTYPLRLSKSDGGEF